MDGRELDLQEINELVQDLLSPNAAIYWVDLGLTALVGWLSFSAGLLVEGGGRWIFNVLAVGALFRGLFFIHELAHLGRGKLPGFRAAWNILFGLPLMVPSFMYEGVHLDHHRAPKYGTPGDPEYLPLGRGSRWRLLAFLLPTLIFPLVFALRFLLGSLLGFVAPRFHRLLEEGFSSLVINEKYRRAPFSKEERRRALINEVAILIFWAVLSALMWTGFLSASFFIHWYVILTSVAFLNQVRTLVAHRYLNAGGEMRFLEQFGDSVNVEGGWLTEYWAPVGARYHALHHCLPKIPYHSLPEAHRRMKAAYPLAYAKVNEASFLLALRKLWISVSGNVPNAEETDHRKAKGFQRSKMSFRIRT